MKTTRESGYDSAFAKKLRDLLESKSVSMTKLGSILGVKQQTVSQWANGSTTPEFKHLKPMASHFEISIDELVTGVAPGNEEFHLITGFSNLAIEKLKKLSARDIDNDALGKNKVIIEFLNIVIENMDSKFYSLSRLAQLCMEYIIGAHKPILEQEDLIKKEASGWEILVPLDRPNFKNDDLDFKTYQLTKDFEYFIEHLTRNPKISQRAKKIYMESNLDIPDYSDSRFEIFKDISEKYPIEIRYTEPNPCMEVNDSEKDA